MLNNEWTSCRDLELAARSTAGQAAGRYAECDRWAGGGEGARRLRQSG